LYYRYGDFILKVNGVSTENMNKEDVGKLIRTSDISLPLTVLRICSPKPVFLRLTLSPVKKGSYGFSYQTQYVVSHADKSSNCLLEIGDQIVKVWWLGSVGSEARLVWKSISWYFIKHLLMHVQKTDSWSNYTSIMTFS